MLAEVRRTGEGLATGRAWVRRAGRWHHRAVVVAVLLIVLAVVLVTVIAFYAVGREVVLLESRVQPAVFELEEAIVYIADRLPPDVQARISHDDVRWVLMADADELEAATAEEVAKGDADEVVDEDDAIALIIHWAEVERPDLTDVDIAAILAARLDYLEAIGAIGDQA